MFAGRDIRIDPSNSAHESINKMMATIELNPYERELLYGYPYIVGQIDDIPIRAPLLTIPNHHHGRWWNSHHPRQTKR